MAAHPQEGSDVGAGLGRRGPSAERQDRPNERRRESRPRRALDRAGARGPGRDRPGGCGPRTDAPAHRADARDAGLEGVQPSRLALRDQVGWLSRAGRGQRRPDAHPDPQSPRRRDVLPTAALTALVDRGARGDRRRRGRGARRCRPTRLPAAPDAARRSRGARARVHGVRPALPRRPLPAERPARGPQAPAQERAAGAFPGPVRVARRRRRGGVLRSGASPGPRRRDRQAAAVPLRAGPPVECLAQAQDPPRAGARRRRLDAGGRERARPRRARGRCLRRRQTAVRGQGRRGVHGEQPQDVAREDDAVDRR